MIEFRWVGDVLQYRERGFQVDAAGAFCGVTEFGEWKSVEKSAEKKDPAPNADDDSICKYV